MVRGLLWLCACALAPTVGNASTSAVQNRHVGRSMSFVRCNTVGNSRCSVAAGSSARATRNLQQARGGSGSVRGHGIGRRSVVEGVSGGDWGREQLSVSPWRLHRRRKTRTARELSAVVGDSSGDKGAGRAPPEATSAENSEKFMPGSRPPEGAAKQDEAVVRYADQGDWKRALQLLKAMRDGDFKPSVTAYVATIEACRRQHLFSYAPALLRDMHRVCMPEDLFEQYAASHPNDPGVTQTQRVFALLLMMREDGVSPLEETYRAIMGLCTKERLWHLSLLLLEHLRQRGLVPGKFVWDEICTVLFKTGHAEMATMLFEQALQDNALGPIAFDVSNGTLDLHTYTASMALATVRIALLDMVRKPSERGYHDPTQPMNIITGMGNNSKDGEAVIKPQVMDMLTAMGLEPKLLKHNEGCIVLQSANLQAYIATLPTEQK